MLTILGFAMIATFLVLIMLKKMSPIAALVLIPALFCVVVGKGAHLGDYVIDGVTSLAPTAAMLMFAIVYFGVMIDVGLFDPVVKGILRFCKADPLRIVVGTAVLAAIVSLDGDGSTTFMITVSAMYPLYKRLKMSMVVMTGVAAMANGVMNTLPWGGPTARAATALKLDASDIFVPMIPALATGLLFVFALAYVLGRRERKRLGVLTLDEALVEEPRTETVLVGAGAGAGAGAGVGGGDDRLPAGAHPVAAAAGAAGAADRHLFRGGDAVRGDRAARAGVGAGCDAGRPRLLPGGGAAAVHDDGGAGGAGRGAVDRAGAAVDRQPAGAGGRAGRGGAGGRGGGGRGAVRDAGGVAAGVLGGCSAVAGADGGGAQRGGGGCVVAAAAPWWLVAQFPAPLGSCRAAH